MAVVMERSDSGYLASKSCKTWYLDMRDDGQGWVKDDRRLAWETSCW